jgi:hypothetical protein
MRLGFDPGCVRWRRKRWQKRWATKRWAVVRTGFDEALLSDREGTAGDFFRRFAGGHLLGED